jgi:RNA polymerase sigma factor (sigma-70 family)
MGDVDDVQLWLQVRSGDSNAFGEIFERHGQAIFRYCFHRTADFQLAEDLMAIVFLEAWRKRRDVKPDSVLPWLFGVAVNVLRNDRRASRRHAAALSRMAAPLPEPDFAEAIIERAGMETRMREILDEIRELAPVEQEILALCVWQGLPASDAGRALGIPEATVRTRLHRARRHLAGSVNTRLDAAL